MTGFANILIATAATCVFGYVLALVADYRWHK